MGSNPMLFWALRGGGPGFGIVISVTMQMHRAPAAIHYYAPTVDWPPTITTPLCPGLASAENKSQWWSEQGDSVLKKVVFNASWWTSLPAGWTSYGTLCGMALLYSGHDLANDLQAPAISTLKALVGLTSLLQEVAAYKTQFEMHMASADVVNYMYASPFSSFLPAASEMGDMADAIA